MMNYIDAHHDLYDAFKCFQHRVTEPDEPEGCLCQQCQDFIPGITDTDSSILCTPCDAFLPDPAQVMSHFMSYFKP